MIANALHSGVDLLESAWLEMNRRWYASRLSSKPGYEFTFHYAAMHAQYWLEHLGHLRDKPNVRLLEIGSLEGGSAVWFLENIVTHPTATITCIDPFLRPGSEARFDHNVRITPGASKLTKVKGRSEYVMPTLEQGAYDVIYIDGCHHAVNVSMDALAGWRLLKDGGIMIFDDYRWRPDLPPTLRPRLAIDLFLSAMNSGVTVLHKDYQVIVRKGD
jgi:predicted O-methyltransferase YrrM